MKSLGIPIIGLHGVADDLTDGLGADDRSTEQAVYEHLLQTREIINANPGIISKIDYEPAFLEMLDYAIKHFWTPGRDEAFKHLAWNEANYNQQAGMEEENLLGSGDDDTLLGFDDLDGVVDGDDLYAFDGLGKTKTPKKERKAIRKQQKAEKKIRKAATKKNPKKAAKKLKKADKKIAKGFFRKAGVVLAKKGDKKALLQHNPVIVAQQMEQENEDEEQNSDVVDEVQSNDNAESPAATDNGEVAQTPENTENTDNNNNKEDAQTGTAEARDDNSDESAEDIEVDDETVEGLLGLGEIPKGNENQVYRHLVATRDILRKHPDLLSPEIDYAPGFLDMLDYAIKHFWTPQRDESLRVLALNEAKMNKVNGVTENDLLGYDDNGHTWDENTSGIVDDDNVYEFDGLGNLGDKNTRKQAKAEKQAERTADKNKNQEERKHAKGFFRKVGVALKQGTKTFKKLNPVLIAMRNSFLLVMKINLFNFAAKAKWGYATPEQAKAGGISDDIYKKSKKFVASLEKLFADKAGGSRVSLKRNVLASKKARLGGFVNLSGPEAAPVIAALPMITAVVKLLSDNGLISKKEADAINAKVKKQDINISSDDAKNLDTIQKEEAANDNTNADNPSPNTGDQKGFFENLMDKAKEHPVLAAGSVVVAAYIFVPPFHNFINGLLRFKKKPIQQVSGYHKNTLEGLGKLKPLAKSPAKPNKLTFITLK